MINVIRVTKHQDHEREVLFRLFYNGKLERNIFLPDYMADEFEERLKEPQNFDNVKEAP